MKLNLLYLDDSFNRRASISALTAALVPSHDYASLIDQFYDSLSWVTEPTPNSFNLNPPELHASELLREHPGVDDERRLATFDAIVDLVLRNRLRLFRVGCFVTPELQQAFGVDQRLLGYLWMNLLQFLGPVFKDELLLPVMDQLGGANLFSLHAQSSAVARNTGLRRLLDNPDRTRNVIGEVLFADSRFSPVTQVVDVIGYLRLISDLASEGFSLSPFKARILPIAHKLDGHFEFEDITVVVYNDQPQEPRHRQRRDA